MTREELVRRQWDKLRAGLEYALFSNRFLQRKFARARLTLADLRSPDDLGRIPPTTKEELSADQESHPPFGSNLTLPVERYGRLHQTSGTSGRRLVWLDSPSGWRWIEECWTAVFSSAGVGENDRLFFPFSFGPFLGFWGAFDAACSLGRLAIPAGGMTTMARIELLQQTGATVLLSTPTYAQRLADVAAESGIDLSQANLRRLILAGEPGASIPAVRERLETALGARVFDHWGMTELGPLAAEETEEPGSLVLFEDQSIVEFIEPKTGAPLPVAEAETPREEAALGELVVTNLGRWDSPLVRYRTGDIVRLAGPGRRDRPFRRLLGGVLGRADDMFWIKGNNVYPAAIETLLRGFGEVCEYQMEVAGSGGSFELLLRIEPYPAHAGRPSLAEAIGAAMQQRFLFRPTIELVPPGTLPRFEMKAQRLVRR